MASYNGLRITFMLSNNRSCTLMQRQRPLRNLSQSLPFLETIFCIDLLPGWSSSTSAQWSVSLVIRDGDPRGETLMSCYSSLSLTKSECHGVEVVGT